MFVLEKPKILLIGSGILQSYGGESWSVFLESIRTRNDLPEDINCPSPLKAIIVTDDHVDDAMRKKFSNSIGAKIENPELAAFLQNMLSVGFDHILTTNYTYELEEASIYPKELTEYRLKKMQTSTCGRCEPKYLLHTYMNVPYCGKENKVWHIHGEARKPESVILGHYYYGNLLCKIREEVMALDKKRWKEEKNKNASWIDAFLFGDVYCLGFGFGLCEFDLWWLINRKARETENAGKVYFYSPMPSKAFDTKLELLKLLKTTEDNSLVNIVNLGYTESDDMDWRNFYAEALQDTKMRMSNVSEKTITESKEMTYAKKVAPDANPKYYN